MSFVNNQNNSDINLTVSPIDISKELPKFTAFQIKVVMVGDNQAKPPKIKELRGISFA